MGTHWTRKAIVEFHNAFEFSRFTLGIRKQDTSLNSDRFDQCTMRLLVRVTDLRAQDEPENSAPEYANAPALHPGDLTEDLLVTDTIPDPVPSLAKALAWNLWVFVGIPALVIFGFIWLIWK